MQPDEKNPSIKHLAHDLNNIFTRILNSIELLKRKVSPSDEAISLLNNIEAGTYLASEIIEDAITNTRRTNLTRRVNINSIVNDVVRSFNVQLKDKIKFVLKLDSKLELINGKFSDLYRVILNLITNSVEAITDTGIIKISTKNINDGKIEFEICDTGTGINPEILPNIFDENFTTKSKHKISGIGLSVVKRIVEEYNGKITVASIPSKETSFILTFPAAAASRIAASEGEKNILVAEDEDVLRELLAELLISYDYKVATASNGKEVLELLNEAHFDLLIIDQKMPVMDGMQCVQELRSKNQTIPIILASGSQLIENSIMEGLQIQKILNKPYNFEEMLSIVKELIS